MTAVAERCFGSGAQATPLDSSLRVGCVFCGKTLAPEFVVRREDLDQPDPKPIPVSQVKAGDRIIVGIIPEHEEE